MQYFAGWLCTCLSSFTRSRYCGDPSELSTKPFALMFRAGNLASVHGAKAQDAIEIVFPFTEYHGFFYLENASFAACYFSIGLVGALRLISFPGFRDCGYRLSAIHESPRRQCQSTKTPVRAVDLPLAILFQNRPVEVPPGSSRKRGSSVSPRLRRETALGSARFSSWYSVRCFATCKSHGQPLARMLARIC